MIGAGAGTVDLAAIEAARPVVSKVAVRTPIFNCRVLSERTGATIVLKAENLQRTGSFKIRGATNKLASLGDAASAGIVVASAGNHAQAAAFAARAAGVSCEVFMPAQASIAKAEATIAYGATVHLGGESVEECMALARAAAQSTGRHLVHPFDDAAIVVGQGTLGLELDEDVPDLAMVLVPLGGGGLAAGIGCALAARRHGVKVVGVQAASCAPYLESLRTGQPATASSVSTLADGIAIKRPGDVTLPLVETYVDEVVAVEEGEIAEAMVLLLERSKLVVEGAGAVGAAALLAGRVVPPSSGSTVVVLSGGNVDTGLLAPVIRRHETNAGRRMVVFARISDRPGSLARLLTCVGTSGGNLVTVEHLREGYDLQVRETGVHLVVETRNRDHAAAVLLAAREAGFEVRAVSHADI